jgi:hypothetical protein
MTYIAPVLGLLAGVVGIADTIPYVRDTVRGSTRPHRGTWLIWSVLVNGAIAVLIHQRRSLLASLQRTSSPARSLG